MQREINKSKLEGAMVLLWIDGAVFVAPVPMLGAFQGHIDANRAPTILQLGDAEAKAANELAAQITVKATRKGAKK